MPMKRYKPEQIVTLLPQIQAEIANGKTIARLQGSRNYPTVLLLPPVQSSSANWPDKNGADENYGPATRPDYRTDSRELTWRPCAPVQYGSHHSLSTAKCQSGILIDVRSVPRKREIAQHNQRLAFGPQWTTC